MQKLYYSIREVSEIVDEEQHILRYWEKEFPELNPKKNRGGNRIYSEKDINLIKKIKHLLRDDKLSLKGAKEQLHLYAISESETLNLLKEIKPVPETQQINFDSLPIVSNADSVLKQNPTNSVLIDVRNFLNSILIDLRK